MACLNKKIVAGIDPGKTGAWALMTEDGELLSYGSYQNRFDAELANADLAILEKVSARPGQGVTSVFNFGVSYGIWQGYLESYGTPFELITPQRWQKSVLDFIPAKTPKPENESGVDGRKRLAENKNVLKVAIASFVGRRYPEMREYLSVKKHWDVADAICLAMYGVPKLKTC